MNSAPTLKESFLAKQDPKTGVSSELLRVLAKLEVDRMTDAVQREQAIQQGQPQGQPTVADTAGQKAEQFMQQQLVQQFAQNHPAQSQQQQAQAPGGLQAAAQVQGAAEGGLTKLQTNLPTNYARGGIVSFSGGGYNDETGIMAKLRMIGALGKEAGNLLTRNPAGGYDQIFEYPMGAYLEGAAARNSTGNYGNEGRSRSKPQNETPDTAAGAPGPSGFGMDLGRDNQFSLKGTSLDKIVAVALAKPAETEGMLDQLRDQFGTERVNSVISKLQAMRDNEAETTSLRNRAGLPNGGYQTDVPGGLATAAAAKAGDSFSDMLQKRIMGMVGDGTVNTDARDKSDRYTAAMYGDEAKAAQGKYRSGLEALKAEREQEVSQRSPIRDIINALVAGTATASKGDWAQALLGSTLSYEAAQQKRKESDRAWAERLLAADVDISKLGVDVGMKRAAAGEAAQEKESSRIMSGLDAGARLESSAAQREQTAALEKARLAETHARNQDLQAKTKAEQERREREAKVKYAQWQRATLAKAQQTIDERIKNEPMLGLKISKIPGAREAMVRQLVEAEPPFEDYDAVGSVSADLNKYR